MDILDIKLFKSFLTNKPLTSNNNNNYNNNNNNYYY